MEQTLSFSLGISPIKRFGHAASAVYALMAN